METFPCYRHWWIPLTQVQQWGERSHALMLSSHNRQILSNSSEIGPRRHKTLFMISQ